MSSVIISGDTSGAVTLAAPAVAGTNTLTLLAATATNSVNVLSTAVALSGTSVEFTSLPSWIKRITVMLYSGVSSNGTSNMQVQIGSGSYTTSGYTGAYGIFVNGSSSAWAAFTTGFAVFNDNAPDIRNGTMVLTSAGSNTWVSSGMFITTNRGIMTNTTGSIALGGALDRIRLTTVNGTDTFDAGSVNILYEG
jgi:hypothetical protein